MSSHLEEDPGGYPIPFSVIGVPYGSRLDSISPSLRYWAVSRDWHNDMKEANDRYEAWLGTRPPGEYPVPFNRAEGKRIDEIEDGLRHWAVHPDRASAPWYEYFKRANDRYEQHLAATREPGAFPYPRRNYNAYTGMPIKDVPQDVVWWALRPSNRHEGWYQPMYDANKCILDEVYKSRSPGSEPIWFGTKYRGLRLDQVYDSRPGFLRWCFSFRRPESGKFYRLRDLVERLKAWRLAHPERSGPRRRRKAPNIQNPVGETIGPWDDSLGSAGEDDSDNDSFVQSDGDEIEYESGENGDAMDDGSEDPDGSVGPSRPFARHLRKRRRPNVILSDEESGESEESDESARDLGRRYRVPYEDLEE